jgi:putative transcriptional regulator
LGFVLNRKYENTLNELIPELNIAPIPVYYGGPVEIDSIHFIHQCPDIIPGGQEVMKGIFWGGDFEMVISLLKNKTLDTNKIRFYIGYSGWSIGQLNDEMNEKTWLTVKATRKLIFHNKSEEIWKDSLKHMGGDYEMMVNFPIDPQLN